MRNVLYFLLMWLCIWFAVEWSEIWYAFAPILFILSFIINVRTGTAAKLGALVMGLLTIVFLSLNFVQHNVWLLNRMTELFNISSSIIFVLIHVLLMALLGALSAGAGAAFRQIFIKPERGYK